MPQQSPYPPTGYGQQAAYPPPGYPPPGNIAPGYPFPGAGQFPPPLPGYPQQWPGYQPPPPDSAPGRSKLLIALAIAVPVVLVLCGVGGWVWFSRSRDEGAIKDAAAQFADAIDTQDQDKFLAALCEEERDLVTDGDGFDPADSGPGTTDTSEPFEVTDVTVKGDVAQVEFLRPKSNDSGSLFLRKESGAWKVCDPAEEQFNK